MIRTILEYRIPATTKQKAIAGTDVFTSLWGLIRLYCQARKKGATAIHIHVQDMNPKFPKA